MPDSGTNSPLFPLRPATRNLRVGLDVRTVELAVADEEFLDILRRDDVEPFVMNYRGDPPQPSGCALATDTVHSCGVDRCMTIRSRFGHDGQAFQALRCSVTAAEQRSAPTTVHKCGRRCRRG